MAADKKSNPGQIVQAVLDVDAQAVKVKLTDTEIAMELSAADGDSVTAIPKSVNSYVSFTSAQSSGTVAILPIDISACNAISLVAKNQGTAVSLTIEVSPSDTADVWVQADTHNATTGITSASPALIACRRARVVFGGNFLGDGQLELWINGRA